MRGDAARASITSPFDKAQVVSDVLDARELQGRRFVQQRKRLARRRFVLDAQQSPAATGSRGGLCGEEQVRLT